MDMTAMQAIELGIYPQYLIERARQMSATSLLDIYAEPDGAAKYAGHASVLLGMIADEFGREHASTGRHAGTGTGE